MLAGSSCFVPGRNFAIYAAHLEEAFFRRGNEVETEIGRDSRPRAGQSWRQEILYGADRFLATDYTNCSYEGLGRPVRTYSRNQLDSSGQNSIRMSAPCEAERQGGFSLRGASREKGGHRIFLLWYARCEAQRKKAHVGGVTNCGVTYATHTPRSHSGFICFSSTVRNACCGPPQFD